MCRGHATIHATHGPAQGACGAGCTTHEVTYVAGMTRVGFLHTSGVHVAAFDRLLARWAPGVVGCHVVDERLLVDARRYGSHTVAADVAARLNDLAREDVSRVCCTCSTIGAVAEEADVSVPVFRVDRPMARRAVGLGRRIGVVAALTSTLGPTRTLLHEEAAGAGRPVEVGVHVAEGAWGAFESGDVASYLRLVARAAREVAATADVVVLAQASMVGAEAHLTDVGVPVLSSPRTAVEHLVAAR